MKEFVISGEIGTSKILIGESYSNFNKYIYESKIIIITDENLFKLYPNVFENHKTIVLKTREENKTLDVVNDIYKELIDNECDRSTFILGFGGGIVCDIVGFVASTYMRGVKFGFVSTTLLSQVDASVGGKNGVNFDGLKNMIGVFNLPEFVICDYEILRTLPQKEVICGLAEIIKHTAIADEQMFKYMEKHTSEILALDRDVIEKLVYNSVIIKSNIVNKDAREKGERRKLNFGHTFGHAIEKHCKLSHGEAVGVGMVWAVNLSVKRKLLNRDEADKIINLISGCKLPVEVSFDKASIINALCMDKKRSYNAIKVILLDRVGSAIIEEISIKELEDHINDLY